MHWTLQPLLRPLFAWLFGILFSLNLPLNPRIWFFLWLSTVIGFIFLERRKSKWKNSQITGLILLSQFFIAGAGIYQWRVSKSERWSDTIHHAKELLLEVTLKEEMPSAGPAYRAVVSYAGHGNQPPQFPVPDILVRFGKGIRPPAIMVFTTNYK